jgi:dTDP-4-dehydrorhamnose 3,5-epimerase
VIVTPTTLAGVLMIQPEVHPDDRGRFLELWRTDRYGAEVTDLPFVQDNVSVSRKGVVRGMHFQHPGAQGKLIVVLSGAVSDVVLDVRRGSPTFGRSYVLEMSAANARQLWIPPGFAHGFQALTYDAVVLYKVTSLYAPASERTVSALDPDLGIAWPLRVAAMSPKDAAAPRLRDLPTGHLPSP